MNHRSSVAFTVICPYLSVSFDICQYLSKAQKDRLIYYHTNHTFINYVSIFQTGCTMQRRYIIISLCWLLSLRRHLRIHLGTKTFEANPFHEAFQSASKRVLPSEDHDIETQPKRSPARHWTLINSHQLSWTLVDSDEVSKRALCQGMGMPLWKRFGIHTSAQGSQGRKRRRKQHARAKQPSKITPHRLICFDI